MFTHGRFPATAHFDSGCYPQWDGYLNQGLIELARWGVEAIPHDWVERLVRRDEVMRLARRVIGLSES